MRCPVDGETLMMTERSGVEIDYCPKCRGVWLDRGELDKIIDRSLGMSATAAPVAAAPPPPRQAAPVYQPEPSRSHPRRDEDRHSYNKAGDEDERRSSKKKRRDSFLADIFDF